MLLIQYVDELLSYIQSQENKRNSRQMQHYLLLLLTPASSVKVSVSLNLKYHSAVQRIQTLLSKLTLAKLAG